MRLLLPLFVMTTLYGEVFGHCNDCGHINLPDKSTLGTSATTRSTTIHTTKETTRPTTKSTTIKNTTQKPKTEPPKGTTRPTTPTTKSTTRRPTMPTTPTKPTSLFCSGGVSGKPQFLHVDMVYRDADRRLPNCEKDCMKDGKCEAYVKQANGCFEARVNFFPGAKLLRGATYLKVNNNCQPLPQLRRMRRTHYLTNHWWGKSTIGEDEQHVVHYCYAKTKPPKCNLKPFGRSFTGRNLSFQYDVLIGYAATKYGECGATQPVQLRNRRSSFDQMWVVQGVVEPIVLKDYTNHGTVFYLWPDYKGVNCPSL